MKVTEVGIYLKPFFYFTINIRFFINLCKKEGFSGNVKGPTSLTYVFTQEMASKVEKELLIYYDIR